MSAHFIASSSALPVSMPPASGGSGCTEARHDALKADLRAWQALPIDNYWFLDSRLHELRRCPRCGSSLMQRIEIVSACYPDRVAA